MARKLATMLNNRNRTRKHLVKPNTKNIPRENVGTSTGSDAEDFSAHEMDYSTVFRRLYYHLYTNSRASRAERIISDLSNLLLCKIVGERNGESAKIEAFLKGNGTANDILLPVLRDNFPHVIGTDESFTIEDDALRYGLEQLASLSFHSAPAHILGEAFQALIGPRLRGDKGQFFTTKSLVRAMVAILQPPISAKVVDPACGTGGFLVEAHASQTRNKRLSDTNEAGKLIGLDKDRDLCRLSEALLKVVAPLRSVILNLNSLDFQALQRLPADLSPLCADFVMTNPPFGTKIKVTDANILGQYALGHVWSHTKIGWKQNSALRNVQDPQILFLELCIRLLKPGGKMGIVLPEGVFGNTSLGYVWDFVRSQGQITALIDAPRTTFQPSTDIKTNILFFQKSKGTESPDDVSTQTWTAVAINCGHDRRGRNTKINGDPYPDDFLEIGAEFVNRESQTRFWQPVRITEPYYLVPRYYDASPELEFAQEAKRLNAKLTTLGNMAKKGYIRIRKGHEVGTEAYGTGDVPFIRTSDISNYEVSLDPTRSVSEDIYNRYANQQSLMPGDILMVSDGRYRIGRTAILHRDNYRCVVQSHIRIISVIPGSPLSEYELLYLLNLPMVQHQIRNLVFIQSTLGSLGKRLYEICVPVPQETDEWKEAVKKFQKLITERAILLNQLRQFEHPGYEL